MSGKDANPASHIKGFVPCLFTSYVYHKNHNLICKLVFAAPAADVKSPAPMPVVTGSDFAHVPDRV